MRQLLSCALVITAFLIHPAASSQAQNHSHVWSQHFGDTGRDVGNSTTVDGAGNVYVTGYFQGTVDFGGGPLVATASREVFVAKYSAAGAHIWSRASTGTSGSNNEGVDIAIDGSGNVIVTGAFEGSIDFGGGAFVNSNDLNTDLFVVQYDPAGTHQWSQAFGDAAQDDRGASVAVDAANNIVVAGAFGGSVDFGGGALVSAALRDVFFVKFNSAGTHLGSARFGGAGDDIAGAVVTDAGGNIFLTGHFSGTVDFGGGGLVADGFDIFVAKYTPVGTHAWSISHGGSGNESSNGIALDGSGNVIVSGRFEQTGDFGGAAFISAGLRDIFLAKYDGSGAHLWSKGFGNTAFDLSWDVCTDGDDNVVMTGSIIGTVDFGGGAVGHASPDVYVAKFDGTGTHLWSDAFGAISSAVGLGVACDGAGAIILTGSISSDTDFGGGVLGPLVNDVFLAKFAPVLTVGALDIKPGSCPNPLNLTMFNTPQNGAGKKGGLLAVAILGADDLDVNDLDVSSLRLEGVAPLRYDVEDVATPVSSDEDCACTEDGPDGKMDLTLKFSRLELSNAIGPTVVGETVFTLTGELTDGTPIELTDCVRIMRNGGGPQPRSQEGYYLGQPFPNPFNPATRIHYEIPQDGFVKLHVYNVSGRLVETLVSEAKLAGAYDIEWDATGFGSGVYFYTLDVGAFSETRKMILLK